MVASALLLAGCGKQASAPEQGGGMGGGAPQAAVSDAPLPPEVPAPQGPERRILALGDSLFAGYGLRPQQSYPARMQAALRLAGVNATVINAGVSGDTTEDGRARLDFALKGAGRVDLVLMSLGGNDMLRGLPPEKTDENVTAMLAAFKARGIPVVVMGMLAAPNMGPDYAGKFNPVFARAARRHGAVLVPFFLQPIYDKPALQLPDHIHPTAQGVEAMVAATLPQVRAALPKG
ncbi:arylesterase [Novosphingobium sp. FSY-8]|uniref:Arylesterase n=2 Tax=Novosphingobium ovatum TaxID=1908523 RepID=A0ABW9XEI0_9SPHN|nr:arylesterase [Novosphingobium ovatum]